MSKIVVVGANHAGTACINTMLDNFGNENEIVVLTKTQTFHSLDVGWHFGSVSKSMVLKVFSTLTKKNWKQKVQSLHELSCSFN